MLSSVIEVIIVSIIFHSLSVSTGNNYNYLDLINDIEYTTDVSNKDYVKAETLEPVNINDFREDYGYLLSRHYDKPKAKKKHWYNFKG